MRIAGVAKLKAIARRVRRAYSPEGVILLYHRIANMEADPFLLATRPEHFAEHLEILRKYYSVLRLSDMLMCLSKKKMPRKAVVVTFDDGYSDVQHCAQPLLESHDIPATVFVSSGYVGSHREPWWDDLERIILAPRVLPGSLELAVESENFCWETDDLDPLAEDRHKTTDRWHIYQSVDHFPRERLFRMLYAKLRPLHSEARCTILAQLALWSGVGSQGRDTYRIFTEEELRAWSHSSLLDVGAHTVNHPVLSKLSIDGQKHEILTSKTRLESILGRQVKSFAYPYGSHTDYTDETVKLVQEAGFRCACSNFPEMVQRRTDRFQLPRYIVQDWDGETFARRLDTWFNE